ncbi:hypothetical protein LAZ67_7001932 [Cordylochernes scorpioides]|uniref:Transposase Tc1-like domain-containing protein n=1 Tax=Cordylochernes scorpioides TaxID=51811 RepID=A0ABY6KMQ4_9ARAC|nr:hypothetical protein LAZ67_7001932 [Cordylochernes scorpioides]
MVWLIHWSKDPITTSDTMDESGLPIGVPLICSFKEGGKYGPVNFRGDVSEGRAESRRLEVEPVYMGDLGGAVISLANRRIPLPAFEGRISLERSRRQTDPESTSGRAAKEAVQANEAVPAKEAVSATGAFLAKEAMAARKAASARKAVPASNAAKGMIPANDNYCCNSFPNTTAATLLVSLACPLTSGKAKRYCQRKGDPPEWWFSEGLWVVSKDEDAFSPRPNGGNPDSRGDSEYTSSWRLCAPSLLRTSDLSQRPSAATVSHRDLFLTLKMATSNSPQKFHAEVESGRLATDAGEIGSRVGRNQTTVMRICDRWMQEGSMDRRVRSHPPQCTTSRADRQIVRMAVTDRSVTSRTVAQPIQSVTHHPVSARTIRRRLQQNGLSARRPLLLRLPLTQNHRRLCRQWCDERRMWTAE